MCVKKQDKALYKAARVSSSTLELAIFEREKKVGLSVSREKPCNAIFWIQLLLSCGIQHQTTNRTNYRALDKGRKIQKELTYRV